MADVKKQTCPECGTENDETAKECTKCKLNLEEFGVFDRFMSARDRKLKRQRETEEEAERNKPKPRKSFLDTLKGR